MATIALAAVGTYIGGAGSILATIGAAVGAYIDQRYIIPSLIDPPRITGPRLDSLRVMTASEGQVMPWVHGSLVRASGNLLWIGDLVAYERNIGHSEESSKQSGEDIYAWHYRTSVAVGICEPPTTNGIHSISKIYGNGKLLYDANDLSISANRYASVTIHDGSDSQAVSSLQEAALGSGLVPAYYGLSYVEFELLELADFGNALPQFSFEIQAESTLTIGDLIARMLQRSGYTSDQYNIDSGLTASVGGYVVAGPTALRGPIEELMFAFDVGSHESNGVLYFYPLEDTEIQTISADELGAKQYSDRTETLGLQISEMDETRYPGRVIVNYFDADAGGEKGSQQQANQSVSNRGVMTVNLSLTVTPAEARTLAAKHIYRLWSEKREASFTLPPRYMYLQEGDLVSIDYSGTVYLLRLSQVTKGFNGIVEVKAVVQSSVDGASALPEFANVDLPGEDANITYPEVYVPPDMVYHFMHLPPLTSFDFDNPCLYFAQCTENEDDTFLGTSIYKCNTENGTYEKLFQTTVSSKIGEVNTTMLSTVGRSTHIASEGSFRVEMTSGVLTSDTEFNVLQGANIALVGDEIIGFTDATLISTKIYELSGIIRGLGNTTVVEHAVSERFVILSWNIIKYYEYPLSWTDSTQWVKVVPLGVDVDDITPTQTTFSGTNIVPFSPCYVKGSRDVSENLTITWLKRTRRRWDMFSQILVPVDDLPESYEIDIMDGVTVKRTITATTETCEYTAAQQTTDFGSTQSSITIRTYQVSSLKGRGPKTEAIL